MFQSRRHFLHTSAQLSTAILASCNLRDDSPLGDAPAVAGPDSGMGPVSAGDAEFVTEIPFLGEDDVPLEVPLGVGLDGRLYTDLSRLSSGEETTRTEDFYVRTRYPDQLPQDAAEDWVLAVEGPAARRVEWPLGSLLEMSRDQGVHVMECAGNHRSGAFGLLSSARWEGVPLARLIADAAPPDSTSLVLVDGFDQHSMPSLGMHSTPGASWILTPDQIEETGAFLATAMNGSPLPPDHGAPLRLLVPGWYGCSCIKWVNRISWVAKDVDATSQMTEFASRTHQNGVPTRARDYSPPEIQQAAMPIRVEQWRDDGGPFYRVLGILWGGRQPARRLEISFDAGARFVRTAISTETTGNQSWTMWRYDFRPTRAGRYDMVCRVTEPDVPQRRLDSGYYLRSVQVDVV